MEGDMRRKKKRWDKAWVVDEKMVGDTKDDIGGGDSRGWKEA
jgi:hypothetical protein